jgi:hypothetical protein
VKKDKLIALLQQIDGNPDIYLWNGFVDDWVDIEPNLVKTEFVKHSKSHVAGLIRFQYMQQVGTFELTEQQEVEVSVIVENSYNKHYKAWDLPNRFVSDEQFKQWYDKKKVVYLMNTKTKGVTYSDRIGDMRY